MQNQQPFCFNEIMEKKKKSRIAGIIALIVSAVLVYVGIWFLVSPDTKENFTSFWATTLAIVSFVIAGIALLVALVKFTSGNSEEEKRRQENLEAIDKFHARFEAQNKAKEEQEREEIRRQYSLETERKRQESQRKLRELKAKEDAENEKLSRLLGVDMEKTKAYLNAVFRHALAERETYQGGEKCEIRLVSEEYKVENGKLLVTFKVSVDVLESVGEFEYGSSWVDKQGRFHGSTTEADARKSARRAVESVQLYAISELEKELNWCYGDNHLKISYKGYVIVPLPRDCVSMKVELINAGAGKYDIRVR